MKTTTNKPIVSCVKVGKAFEDFVVLKDVNFSLQAGEKCGLVGANGSGKSTLLEIISGDINADKGVVTIPKSISLAYIPQDFQNYNDVLGQDFITSLMADKKEIPEHILFTTLGKLHLEPAILNRYMGELSGGEKTKLGLVRILLSDYDFYLLDEPTNNLDTHALALLEAFVKESAKTFLIVSHDREFLDRTVDKIIEISEHSKDTKIYEGNFSAYLAERKHNIELQWSAYNDKVQKQEQLETNTKDKLAWVKVIDDKIKNIKNLPKNEKEKGNAADYRDQAGRMGHRAKVAKDRAIRFADNNAEIEKPKELKPLIVNFEIEKRSGDKVFELKDITKSMPDLTLGPINLTVQYGDKILITGDNGSGKSTLIKIILSLLKSDSGEVKTGTAVSVGYMPQQEDFLPDSTVLEEFLRHTKIEEGMGRRTLNRFRITTDDLKKKMTELSSGERSRLILAIIMANKHNCLVLDEPSNHLDLEVLEEFEDALQKFEGTIIAVSHDRYFVKKIGFKTVYSLMNGKLSKIKELE